jgi:hypothetical protein
MEGDDFDELGRIDFRIPDHLPGHNRDLASGLLSTARKQLKKEAS